MGFLHVSEKLTITGCSRGFIGSYVGRNMSPAVKRVLDFTVHQKSRGNRMVPQKHKSKVEDCLVHSHPSARLSRFIQLLDMVQTGERKGLEIGGRRLALQEEFLDD